eukprot:COSAG01_NODE_346_length_18524_cov_35.929661_10_plen_76_part_00
MIGEDDVVAGQVNTTCVRIFARSDARCSGSSGGVSDMFPVVCLLCQHWPLDIMMTADMKVGLIYVAHPRAVNMHT